MRRTLLPAPVTSLLLLASWLMLNQSLAFGHWLLGASLALVIPWLVAPLRPQRASPRRPLTIVHLLLAVLWDIVVSNVEVARRVLGPESAIRPRFVRLPLTIADPHGIAVLASVISLTPGTLSADLEDDGRTLLVHALHCPDDEAAQALVATIRARYEAPLLEIFGS